MNEENTNKSLSLTPDYIETYKYSKWVEYYTDEKDPKTYGNAVQSALKAYNTKTYACASKLGCDNVKKFKYARRIMAEKNGFTFDKFQKATIAKFLKSEKPEWFEKVKEVVGFDELPEILKGQGVSVKTENKDGTVSEIKIVNFEKIKEDDKPNA